MKPRCRPWWTKPKRGIRVLLDVVMNHVGYATLADLQDVGPQA